MAFIVQELHGNDMRGFKTVEGQEISRYLENYLKIATHHFRKRDVAAELWR